MRHRLYKIKSFFLDLFSYPQLAGQNQNYDQYWLEKKKGQLGVPNFFQLERARWIAGRIQANSSVIDVGCGDGSVLFAIKQIKGIHASGVDVSKLILEFLEKNGVEAHFLNLAETDAVLKIPIKDHAMVLEVLEHMVQPEEFLQKLLLRVNKSVFLSIPNTGYIQHRLRLLFGSFPVQWRAHPSEHLRFWTLRDFRWWIKALGVESKTVYHCYAGIPILNQIWPSLFAQGIIAEIKK
jgi:methionine biosynthesis protein MetW